MRYQVVLNNARADLLNLLRDGLSLKFDRIYLTYLDWLARIGTKPMIEVFRQEEKLQI
jgi:predicted site-specific integrase-resolvase